ncbi:hypothetical protein Ade02nite_20970 [Paractinoplanes deccanensis]|uniref:Uncharacterized protein n=1 Tax=Paractinoplanes deccanensis TaxID=113561 RepID=A0ABQ3Y0D3_9ACTN|nr:hypothetical protein [Actinoplanes deccanensis]GID73456.1 hypothetical protein Ade02nite_20970 [Actinoplanes deccanensis]
MTTTLITVMNCDFPTCEAQAPKNSGGKWMLHRPDGWTDAIQTHGCPEHGDLIAAHQAKITSGTRGRGAREKTTWYLTCSCEWRPTPNWQTYNADWLRKAHLAHVHEQTA